MSASEITSLSVDERLELIGKLWDSLTPANIPLSADDRAELDRRVESLDADLAAGRPTGIPWEQFSQGLRKRAKDRLAS